nr:immunoglobulin light chain junction region [Mus musculus]NSM01131.1 immunoglobulin light chain junction region [Mus musculus]NSM01806.1 immunoglobulin light chain junction region [Mus musculus]NSM02410.1 immunoglobulin light chain junction region [Mus musculus]
CQQGSSSPLTF